MFEGHSDIKTEGRKEEVVESSPDTPVVSTFSHSYAQFPNDRSKMDQSHSEIATAREFQIEPQEDSTMIDCKVQAAFLANSIHIDKSSSFDKGNPMKERSESYIKLSAESKCP